MNITKRLVSLTLILALSLLALSACSANTTEGKLKKQFDTMYKAYNQRDYETYASYFKLDDNIVSNMKLSFEMNGSIFDTVYSLDDVNVFSDTEESVVAEIVTLNTTKTLADGITRVMKEHITYTFSVEEDVYYIIGYEIGQTELVDVPAADTETLSEEEYYSMLIDGLEGTPEESAAASE